MQNKEEIEKAYWKGYIQKQNEAMEICKQCKYIKKARKLETREQKLIERLEREKKLAKKCQEVVEEHSSSWWSYAGMIAECEAILIILKGEKIDE